MVRGRNREATIAVLGVLAFGASVFWFGVRGPGPRPAGEIGEKPPNHAFSPTTSPGETVPSAAARGEERPPKLAEPPPAPRAAEAPAPVPTEQTTQQTTLAAQQTGREPGLPPSFDVVRVEPTGESVIAGRAAPGSTVELIRNGRMHARVASDPSGLFAFVPPPLWPGSHEIVLQSIAPDGVKAQSRESVTIVVAEKRDTKPLITLTAPDKPTVILSAPEAPAAVAEARPAAKPGAGPATSAETRGSEPSTPAPAAAAAPETAPPQGTAATPQVPAGQGATASAARPQIRIGSVEAEEGGRLFVSGKAAPGATVRLYLNEALVAPGGAGPDGKVSFAIGRGVKPGGYRVRLDDVNPVTGEVKSRAEVEFTVPAALLVELPPPVLPYVTHGQPAVGPQTTTAASPSPAGSISASPSAASPSAASSGSSSTSPATVPATPGLPTPGPTAAAPTPLQSAPPMAAPGQRLARVDTPGGGAPTPSPRELDPGTIVVPEINTAIVSRGDTLWRISRRIYGSGVRYTVIYGANQEQIRRPGLIYPGQVFVLPAEGAQTPAP